MTARRRIIALLGLTAGIALGVLGVALPAQAATVAPCNSYHAVLAGEGMECTVTVDNYVDGLIDYSTVTIKECHGAAFTVLLAPACQTTIQQNTTLTLDVTQCNGTLNGGGSNVTCDVIVTNHFSGTAVSALATLNQCIGSGGGGVSPVGAPLNCSPPGLTVGATVTQCNGSVNGGGGPLRVNCSVPIATASAIAVLVNQCNGTVNGGGSVLFCTASFADSFNEVGMPAPPAIDSTTGPVTSTTGGTFGTPGGPVNPGPPGQVGGSTVTAASSAAALAATGGTGVDIAGPLMLASGLFAAGSLAVAFARRRNRGAHRAR